MSSFRERRVSFKELVDLVYSDKKYLLTGIHLSEALFQDKDYVIVYHGDKPVLGYPLSYTKMYGMKTLMLYLVGLPYLGFIVFDEKIFRDIDYYLGLVKYLNKSSIRNYRIVFVKNPPYLHDPRGFIWSSWYFRTEFTYISYPEKLSIDKLRKIRRREYKKSLKEKYTIVSMDFKDYIKYYLEMAKAKGFYKRAGIELINALVKQSRDEVLVYVAKSDKGIGAGESFFIDNYLNTCYRLFPFTTEYGRRTGASTYLLYHVLKEYLSSYDYIVMLGGMTPDIARFVQDFSHEIKTYYSFLKINAKLLDKTVKPLVAFKGFTTY